MTKVLKDISLNKGFSYLLIKILLFGTIVFCCDRLIGGLFNHYFFRQTSGWDYRTKFSIEDTKADILIFGASRAQQQYNPFYFEEGLKQTCYNTGRDGESIFYNYAILKSVLNRYTPKVIILDIENGMFRIKPSSYERISVLLPYYQRHPELRSVIELKSPFEKYKLLSKIYPYNSMLFKIALGNSQFNYKSNDNINGYVPLSSRLNEQIQNSDLSGQYPLDTNKISIYTSFINDCVKAKIALYIVCSPYFMQTTGSDISINVAKQIASLPNVRFYDFSKDETFLRNSALFNDKNHVNTIGAKIFSKKLVDSLLSQRNAYTVN